MQNVMQNHYLEQAIARHPFWAGLNPHFLHFLNECAEVEHYRGEQMIFHEGGQADHLYLIVKGGVALEAFVPGKGRVVVQTLGPGEALGWSWLFPPHQWQFSARALEPCEVIAFGGVGLRERAEENHEFASELTTRVARLLLQRLQATRQQLVQFYEPID